MTRRPTVTGCCMTSRIAARPHISSIDESMTSHSWKGGYDISSLKSTRALLSRSKQSSILPYKLWGAHRMREVFINPRPGMGIRITLTGSLGRICPPPPPANSAPMKARITKFLWAVVWLKISISCNFGDPRSISSRSNTFQFSSFILCKSAYFRFFMSRRKTFIERAICKNKQSIGLEIFYRSIFSEFT